MTITRRLLTALIPVSGLGLWRKAVGEDQQPPIGDPAKGTAQIEFHNATDVTKMYILGGCFVIRHEDFTTRTVYYRSLDLKDPSAPWLASPRSTYVEGVASLKVEYGDGD